MVVNGDDILYKCVDDEHYKIWKDVTAKCGLKFSLGKNYTSKKFLVINSELYKTTRSGKVKKTQQLNVRLLYGGTRSSSEGVDLRLSDYIESLKSLHVSTDEHRAQYLSHAITKARAPEDLPEPDYEKFLIKNKKLQEFQQKGTRLEMYTRWRVTIPQRAAGLLQQLKGDYEVTELQRDRALRWFNEKQINRFRLYREFNGRDKHVSYYLPQTFGGLGLMPRPDHNYSPFDSVLVQILSEDSDKAERYCDATSRRLTRAEALQMIGAENARVSKRLGIESELIPIEEWDEHLERHGETAPVSGTLVRAHVDQRFHMTTDTLNLSCEKYIEDRRRWSVIKNIHRLVRERLNRRENKGLCPMEIDLNRSEVREKRLSFNTRRFTPTPLMP